MTRRSCHHRFVVLLGLVLLLPACRKEDVTGPLGGGEVWQEIGLESGIGDAYLTAVDFGGGTGRILGYGVTGTKAITEPVLLRYADGAWQLDAPGELPGVSLYTDLALDAAGALVLSGYLDSGDLPCRVYDTRGALPQNVAHEGLGMYAVDGEDGLFVAGGFAAGGTLWTSTAPGVWKVDALPLGGGSGDAGFRDVDVRGGVAVACGFDDGADVIAQLLRRTADTGWQNVALAADAWNATLHSVALAADGSIWVGGVAGAGGLAPQAYLAVRDAGGAWSRVALPDVGLTGAVNDILVAQGGVVYAVCSGEVGSGLATIVRIDGGVAVRDMTPVEGALVQLDQAPDGRLWAVGWRQLENNVQRALLLKRATS